MPKFTKKQLAMIALSLDEEEDSYGKNRNYWVRKMLTFRKQEGEFHTLFRELQDEDLSFYKYFRMSQYQFFYLLKRIAPRISKQNTSFREAIGACERLMVCLRFLTTGDSFQTIAFSFRLGHSTVHGIVKEVCEAIIDEMLTEVMPQPSVNSWEKIAEEFWNMWNFPNCLGALDGKHVEIFAPSNSGSLYYNYKHTFSVVLLALVDANCKFIAVDIGAMGKNSDGGIFSRSKLGKSLEAGQLNVPKDRNLPGTGQPAPYVIVGDEAFPLKTYLQRPFPGSTINGDVNKQIFNYRLSRARRVSENCFGQLAHRFRIYFRKINSSPQYVDKIILTTCILHNYIKDDNTTFRVDAPEGELNITNLPRQGGNAEASAFAVRETFKDFFVSTSGSLPWQWDKVL